MRCTVLLVSLIAVAVATTATGSHSIASFYTPEKAAYCNLQTDITGESWFMPYLVCWTPNDGFTATLTAKGGRPRTDYFTQNRWLHSRAMRRLRYGQDWWANSNGVEDTGRGGRDEVLFRCQSRSTGLRCENKAGHGFSFGRFRGYRLF